MKVVELYCMENSNKKLMKRILWEEFISTNFQNGKFVIAKEFFGSNFHFARLNKLRIFLFCVWSEMKKKNQSNILLFSSKDFFLLFQTLDKEMKTNSIYFIFSIFKYLQFFFFFFFSYFQLSKYKHKKKNEIKKITQTKNKIRNKKQIDCSNATLITQHVTFNITQI